jgi:glycosyltransferase involved in cell wall biosynthesis
MKFLTFSLYHPRVMKGGAQYVAKDLHDAALADPQTDAVMLAAIDGNRFPQYAKVGSAITGLPDSTTEFLLPGQQFDDFHHVVYDARRSKAIARFLRDHRPDVIHMHHSLWVGLEFLDLARKVLPDVKIIYTLHEYLPICHAQGQLYRYAEGGICQDTSPDQCTRCFPDRTADDFILRRRGFRRAFDLVDHFIAPSDYLRQRYIAWGLDPARISVIANGHTRRRPDGWVPRHSPGVNVFGFFGQFVDAKGIDVLLRAAADVAADTGEDGREVEVRIFGGNKEYASAAYVARIDAVLDAAPDTLRITEMGPYSRENVFDLMASVDWVVVPSVWPETFGLVVSEAWDARRPVLASRAGGLTDRIREGENGFTFLPGSADQLADLMRTCIGNAELWQSLSRSMGDEITLNAAWTAHKDVVGALADAPARP